MSEKGTLYLLPSTLGEGAPKELMPPAIAEVIGKTKHYFVEDIRSTRRFLRSMDSTCDIDGMTFIEVGKHADRMDMAKVFRPTKNGENMAVVSEAGCPGIADPGSRIVAKAHELGVKVVPIVGPSAFYLALMASGFNGQQFKFHGYVPKERKARAKAIGQMESAAKFGTQIFMEVPFRNHHLLEDILAGCHPETKLCIAADITLPGEYIRTRTISEWKKKTAPDLKKRPCVFLFGC